MVGLRLQTLWHSFEDVMAGSDISGYFSSFEGTGDDGADGINIDEILETAIEEAENQDDFNEDSRNYLHGQSLRNLPTNLYDASQIIKANGF